MIPHTTRDETPTVNQSDETEPLLGRFRMSAPIEEPAARVETGLDSAIAKRVLKKIDRVMIPLLFFTYVLNFMDKIILSSAAVFGLREDNVGDAPFLSYVGGNG